MGRGISRHTLTIPDGCRASDLTRQLIKSPNNANSMSYRNFNTNNGNSTVMVIIVIMRIVIVTMINTEQILMTIELTAVATITTRS